MNIFIFSILIVFSTEAMIDVGLAGLSQMKVRVRYREKDSSLGWLGWSWGMFIQAGMCRTTSEDELGQGPYQGNSYRPVIPDPKQHLTENFRAMAMEVSLSIKWCL